MNKQNIKPKVGNIYYAPEGRGIHYKIIRLENDEVIMVSAETHKIKLKDFNKYYIKL